MDIDNIIDEYNKKQYPIYEKLTLKNEQLIREILDANNIKYILESRTKKSDNLREKILRDDKSYKDPLNEITDFSGLRIILHNLTDLNKIF